MGNLSPEIAARKSLTHWVWTPYMDISNMAPWGIKTQLGYRDQRWTVLKRCTPYPLGNLTYVEADREATAEFHAQGITNTVVPPKEIIKYAQAQASELGESYGDAGLRVLVPLLGMDDAEIVNQIVQVVQPFAYDLYEMRAEFTTGAQKRIAESNLSRDHRRLATALASVMLNGAIKAEETALREYRALITSMSDAQIGKPGLSEPNDFHEWICHQLNKPLPKRVDRMGGQDGGGNETMVKVLLDRDAQREQEVAELRAQVAAQVSRPEDRVEPTPEPVEPPKPETKTAKK
jgi:hypothetical protein